MRQQGSLRILLTHAANSCSRFSYTLSDNGSRKSIPKVPSSYTITTYRGEKKRNLSDGDKIEVEHQHLVLKLDTGNSYFEVFAKSANGKLVPFTRIDCPESASVVLPFENEDFIKKVVSGDIVLSRNKKQEVQEATTTISDIIAQVFLPEWNLENMTTVRSHMPGLTKEMRGYIGTINRRS